MNHYITLDSGEREAMPSGAQRDTQVGKPRYDLIPTFALKRLAELYARGAEKYDDRNWEKGMPFSRLLASLERHLHAYKQGELTEDHLAAVVWNALAIMHFEEVDRDEELNDLPQYVLDKPACMHMNLRMVPGKPWVSTCRCGDVTWYFAGSTREAQAEQRWNLAHEPAQELPR